MCSCFFDQENLFDALRIFQIKLVFLTENQLRDNSFSAQLVGVLMNLWSFPEHCCKDTSIFIGFFETVI